MSLPMTPSQDPEVKALEEKIKPILEKLVFHTVKKKPDNIVS